MIDQEHVEEEALPNLSEQARLAFDIRDRVLDLSHTPKLVVGPAKDESEISTTDGSITDEDLEYLFRWVASGGVIGSGLENFPQRPAEDALASAGGKGRRNKAVGAGGDIG